jgi:hypothetical protein
MTGAKSAIAIAAVITGFLGASPRIGRADELQYKISSYSMELTQCYGYYSMVSHCAQVSNEPVLAKKTADIAGSLLPLIYQSGKAGGLLDSALLGRIQMVIDSIKSDMASSCVNIATIYAKYSTSCKALVENPQRRLKAMLTK